MSPRAVNFHLGLLVVIFLLAGLMDGCAETCKPAAEKAARHGIVLECKKDRSDSRRDVCTVSTKDGDVDYHYWRCQ